MLLNDEQRAVFGASVPVYVEAAADGTFRLMETLSGDVLSSEHATARTAMATALLREDIAGFVKPASMRTDGELDAEWRWLDAAAVEDAPLGDPPTRICAQSIWELAESLNTRGTTAAINGGPTPPGLATSEPHGDAVHGSDHPANGRAHVGLPVISIAGRTHLFLWSELIPAVAAEVASGRLAYGSVFFDYGDADPADDYAVYGCRLISHALTNDPAVTSLGPGSERRSPQATTAARARREARTAWRCSMNEQQITALLAVARNADETLDARRSAARQIQTAARGPVGDHYAEVSTMLGVTAAERNSNMWALEDAIFELEFGSKGEDRLAAVLALTTPAPAPVPVAPGDGAGAVALTAEQGAELVRLAVRGVFGRGVALRMEDGEEELPDGFGEAMLALGQVILGKPDASADDILAELQAREEELAAVLEPSGDPPEDPPADGGQVAAANAARSATESVARASVKLTQEVEGLTLRVRAFEAREWITAELVKRELVLPPVEVDGLVTTYVEHGESVVTQALRFANLPPNLDAPDHDAQARPSITPRTQGEAVKRCLEESDEHSDQPLHVRRRHATARARDEWPDLFVASDPN